MQQVVNFKRNDSYTRISVRFSDPLRETLEIFRQNRAVRILAVVDEENRPIGVIREVDVRDLLFNPFGHALMSNPGFGKSIQNLVRPCAAAEQHLESSELIAIFAGHPDSPGVVLTIGGQFFETLSDDQLLELMAQGQVARAEKITSNSELFTQEILWLSDQLCDTAKKVHALSQVLSEQADGMTEAAHDVAAGAAQSSSGLKDVNERGHKLAGAMEQLTVVASEAKLIRVRANDIIDAAEPQMKALAKSGMEIGSISEVIHGVGRKTNFLALNAQIEAVRQDADHAGFVAVAGEIKQLATQTRSAADEVSKKVNSIGKAVGDVLAGHSEIVDAMAQISAISNQIDSAVSEHSATSLVVACYVEQAADATADISARAHDIGTRARHVQSSAKDLERVSTMLLNSATDIRIRSQEFVQAIQFA
jgi:methyl-accepting chemotaxis protein